MKKHIKIFGKKIIVGFRNDLSCFTMLTSFKINYEIELRACITEVIVGWTISVMNKVQYRCNHIFSLLLIMG